MATSRKRSLSPNATVFKEIINMKYKTEKYIALINNTQRKCQAKRKLFIDSKLSYQLYHRSDNYIIINVCT